MLNFKNLCLVSALTVIASNGTCLASNPVPEEDKPNTNEKIGREVARVEAQASGAVHDAKQGYKEGKKKLKDKYRKNK